MTRKRHVRIAGFLFALLTLVAATPVAGQQVEVTVSPSQDFSKLNTYGWGVNRIGPKISPEERVAAEKSIRAILNRELAKKGYREVSQNPDFLIELRAGTLPGEVMTSARDDLTVPDNVVVYNSQFPQGPGLSVWMAVTAGARIVVTDSAAKQAVWEALVTKKYKNPDRYKKRERLEKEMDSFFTRGIRDFPSRTPAKR